MKVKALQYMYYQRREYQAGDEYEMDDREEGEAKLLATLGKIEILKAEQNTDDKPFYRTMMEKPEATPKEVPQEEASKDDGRRTYKRRDMRSER